MNISSRTPEGTPNRCPICGTEVKIVPSEPTGDAPCPACGSLLWFMARGTDVYYFEVPVAADTEMVAGEEDLAETPSDLPPTGTPVPQVGVRVRVRDGNFGKFEGAVAEVDSETRRVTVMINIFGRSTPVELYDWQVEPV